MRKLFLDRKEASGASGAGQCGTSIKKLEMRGGVGLTVTERPERVARFGRGAWTFLSRVEPGQLNRPSGPNGPGTSTCRSGSWELFLAFSLALKVPSQFADFSG